MSSQKQFSSIVLLAFLSCITLLNSCKCDNDPYITSFAFNELSPAAIGDINNAAGTIEVKVPASTNLAALTPNIIVEPDCFTLEPSSRIAQDFSQPVSYTVTNEVEEEKTYEVTVLPEEGIASFEVNWEEKTPVPVTIGWTPIVELNDKIYVIGGVQADVNVGSKMYIYDPLTDSWDDSGASLNTSRWGHSADVVNGKIYVIGGVPEFVSQANNSVEIYDPLTDKWIAGANLPERRSAHGSCVIGNKIFIVGGETEEPTKDYTVNTLFEYDTENDTWNILPPMTRPRAYLMADAVDGKIYAAGGSEGPPYDATGLVEVYDPETQVWTEQTEMLFYKWAAGSCVIDDLIYYLAGSPFAITPGSVTTQAYSPSEDKWYQGSNIIQRRLAAGVCSHDGKIVIVGGAISPPPWETNTNSLLIGDLKLK